MALLNATMRAVMFYGRPFEVAVEDRPIPTIQNTTDAIIRISHAAICGSDMHFYRWPGNESYSVGHEAIGWVESIGTGVNLFHEGDWVVVPDNLATPAVASLEQIEVPGPDRIYPGNSGSDVGGYQDTNLVSIPVPRNTTNTTEILTYLFVSDIWATAWAAISWSGFQAGDTVAVFGAGPVGLLAAYSALLRGASKVYSVDYTPQRLALAESIGALPINFNGSSPVEQILSQEPDGVNRALDCVGWEALNTSLQHDDGAVLRDAIGVVGYDGGIGQVGVYETTGRNTSLNDGVVNFPVADFFDKGVTYRGGVVDVRAFSAELIRLLEEGKADPTFIVSATVRIEDAPEYYQRFSDHLETKVVIEFPFSASADGTRK